MSEKHADESREEGAGEKRIVYSVDSFANGISFGQHRAERSADPREHYELRLFDDAELIRLRSRYALHRNNPLHELELQLMKLSRQGVLAGAEIYFGTTTDPFFPFEGKFDASIRFLELFQRYTPGLLTVQTRSPLIVIAMPIFKKLGRRCAVTLGIETNSEESVRRYTPGFPRIEERLKTATALRRFGVEVTLQVSPLLPYGDWRTDAASFATLLNDHADRIIVRPVYDAHDRAKNRGISQRIAHDRLFHYLRPDSANPLITALEAIAPEKLQVPVRGQLREKQLSIFAA